MNNPLMDELRHLVGAANLLTEDLDAFVTDWRKRVKGRALCVVRPAHTEEVAAVVKACSTAGVSIVPQGGNTGLVVGSIPDAGPTGPTLGSSSYQMSPRQKSSFARSCRVTASPCSKSLQTFAKSCNFSQKVAESSNFSQRQVLSLS